MNNSKQDINYLNVLHDTPEFKETISLIRSQLNTNNPILDEEGIRKFAQDLHIRASILVIILGLNVRFLSPLKHYILTGKWIAPAIPQTRKEPFKRRSIRVDNLDIRRQMYYLKNSGYSHTRIAELLTKLNYHYEDPKDVSKQYIKRYSSILLALIPQNKFLIRLRLIKLKQILKHMQ